MCFRSLIIETIFKKCMNKNQSLNSNFFFPLQIVLTITIQIHQILSQWRMKLKQLTRMYNFVFFNGNNYFISSVNRWQIFFRQTNNKRHETFLSSIKKLRRQIRNIHVTPFQRQYHPHDGFYDQCCQIRVVRCEYYLFLHEDSRKNLSESMGWKR